MLLGERGAECIAPPAQGQAFYLGEVLNRLALCVTANGVKSFVVEKRIRGRVTRKVADRCQGINSATIREQCAPTPFATSGQNSMLEYVLFAEQLRGRFTSWLDDNGIEYQTAGDEDELLVLIDEEIDADEQERIEAQYDLLLDESARIADAEDDSPDVVHLVGIRFQRSDGMVGMVRITPELANRLHRCLDMVELQDFVQTVVDAVENPDNRPLCRR